MALFRVSTEPLVNYETQDGVPAALCREFMQRAVNDVLQEHYWSCAKARQRLAPLADAPEDAAWKYQYQLPVKPRCLVVRGTSPKAPWERQGQILLSNEGDLVVIYTKEVTNPTEIDDDLDTVISLRLAVLIGPKISGTDASTVTKLDSIYEKELLKAKAIDALGSSEKAQDPARTFWDEVG
jgi:hypothetical protein